MSAIDKEPFPKPALYAAGALVALSMLAAGLGRWQTLNTPPDALPASAVAVQSVELFFADQADGSIIVTDASDGTVVTTLASGEDAFIRGVMRGLVRARTSRGIGDAEPFQLQRLTDGKLLIGDAMTGKSIDLRAFGHTQRDAFARLLDKPSAPARP